MNKLITKIVGAALGLTMAIGVGVAVGTSEKEAVPVHAAETAFYTLDGTTTASGSSYAGDNEVTQDNVSWVVNGNVSMNPWRIGGKKANNVTTYDRLIKSTDTVGTDKNVTKVELVVGAASSITVNSLTLDAGSTAGGNDYGTVSGTFSANSTITFERPSGKDWTGRYFTLTFNVTIDVTSNKFVEFNTLKFYYNASTPLDSIGLSGTDVTSNAMSIGSSDSTAHTVNVSLTPSTATDPKVNIAHQSGTSGLFTLSAAQITCSSGSGSFTVTGTGATSGSETFRISGNTETSAYVDLVVTALDDSATYYDITLASSVSSYYSLSGTTHIESGETADIYLVANAKYNLPTTITASGAGTKDENWGYTSGTGEIEVLKVTSDIEISFTVNPADFILELSGYKTTFKESDGFSVGDLVVTAIYDDAEGTEEVISSSSYSVDSSDFDEDIVGTYTITVSYSGVKESYDVNVVASPSDFTWDLTTNSYDSASTTSVVWTNAAVNMTLAKASSNTNANNYIPTSYSSTRVYNEQTLTFAPNDTYSIESIEITCTSENYATALYNGSWTNATKTVSTTKVTLTATDGESNVVCSLSGTSGISSVIVHYYHDTSTKLLSVDPSSIVVAIGGTDTATLTPSNFVGETVSYSNTTNACATLAYNGNTVEVTGVAKGNFNFTITATGETSGATATTTLSVTVYDPSLYYGKVNQTSDIVPGDRYVMVANGTTNMMGAQNGNYRNSVDGSSAILNDGANVDSTELPSGTTVFTLIGTGNSNEYYLYSITDSAFFVGSDSSVSLTTNASIENASTWTITVTSGVATISLTNRTLVYNIGSPRFATYGSGNYANPILYRISGSSLKDDLNIFKNDSLKMNSYDVGGKHGSTDGDGSCTSYYLPAKAAFNDLSAAEQQLFKTSSEYSAAKQRYEDWATANHDGAPYDGNDDIQTKLSAIILSNIISNSSNTYAIIIVVSLIGITAIGGYFFIRKRKEQQ